MKPEIMAFVTSVPIQFHFQFQFQCRGSNAEIYKWPLVSIYNKYFGTIFIRIASQHYTFEIDIKLFGQVLQRQENT